MNSGLETIEIPKTMKVSLQVFLPRLDPWDKANLVMMYDLFNILLDSVC